MFNLIATEPNYRKPKDKEIIIVFVSAGGFIGVQNIINKLKPVLVQYDLQNDQFIAIENSLPVIPFLTTYNLPGWQIFNNTFYRDKIIESIKRYGQTFTR